MHVVDDECKTLAVLAVPLAVITLAGGVLSVMSLDAARDARRAQEVAAATGDLIELQQAVGAERALAVRSLATGHSADGVRVVRRATDKALAQASQSLRVVRRNPRPAARAHLAEALRAVRRSVDQEKLTIDGARAGYAAVTDEIVAVPAAVAARIGDDRLADPAAALVAGLRAAEAVTLVQLAGDRVLWSGRAAGRAEYDDLAGRRGALERALADLPPAAPADTPAWGPLPQADLRRLTAGAPARAGAAAWDASAQRLAVRLLAGTRANADDVAVRSAAVIRTRTRQALAAVLVALLVVAGGLAHATLARVFARGIAFARERAAGVLTHPLLPGVRLLRPLVAGVRCAASEPAPGWRGDGWPFAPAPAGSDAGQGLGMK